MNYIASASNNSEDLIGSESGGLLSSSTDNGTQRGERVKNSDRREIEKSSSDKKHQALTNDPRQKLQVRKQQRSTNQSLRMRKSAGVHRRTNSTSQQLVRSPTGRQKKSKTKKKDALESKEDTKLEEDEISTTPGLQTAGSLPLEKNPDLMKYLI